MATDSPLLTDGQRKLAGFAIALFALVASIALLVSVVWALAWLLGRFGGVLWPLAAAGVVALILRPAVDLLEQRLHQRRLTAVIVLYSLFLVAAAGLGLLVVPRWSGRFWISRPTFPRSGNGWPATCNSTFPTGSPWRDAMPEIPPCRTRWMRSAATCRG